MSRNSSRSRLQEENGQTIVMVGLMAIILAAIAGLAVDVGRLYVTKAQLSRSVDAAALSGILEFNGQSSGLTAGEAKAEAYFDDNEPGGATTRNATANGAQNEMTMDATKSVDMIFLGLLGLGPVTVSAHAKAGFGTLTVDSVIVLDATSSMGDSPCDGQQDNSGCPIWEAKNAAISFKDILLGSAPTGNVTVGVAAFRGCYRGSPTSSTSPMNNSTKTNCVRSDSSTSSQTSELISDPDDLEDMIENINAIGGSGTNVCNGMLKGWEVLDGDGNHQDVENNRQYLIVLTDGDNNYTGSYTYQASPASPHTYNSYSCMPPSSCSNVGGEGTSGSNLCQDGVHTTLFTIAQDNFDGPSSSCPSAFNAGSGWAANWVLNPTSGNDAPTYLTSSSPNDTSCHVRIRGDGTMHRRFSLSGVTATVTLHYYAKYNSWESGDDAMVEISTNATSWTVLRTHTTSNTSTGYNNFSSDISSYAGQSQVYVRFRGSMTDNNSGDDFFVDTIEIEGGDPGSSNGYLNGASPSLNCDQAAGRRERQLDLQTYDLSKGLKAATVEIFVVAFGVCSDATTVCGDDVCTAAECDAQVGNTDIDNIGDQRLMKCIASSSVNTNDHYYYATSASQLGTIFTAIANQIAHRLIE